jgi:hypothetical protein
MRLVAHDLLIREYLLVKVKAEQVGYAFSDEARLSKVE